MWGDGGNAGAGYGPPQGSYQRLTQQQGLQQHGGPRPQHGFFEQESPAKRFKGCGDPGSGGRPLGKGGSIRTSGDPNEVGEVRFFSEDAARRAVELFDNSAMMGLFISVALDPRDVTKVLVSSMPAGIAWQELKDHFQQVGEVHYANIGRSTLPTESGGGAGAKGFGRAEHNRPNVGEVRYYTKEDADRACELFNGRSFRDGIVNVRPDLSSFQGTKLLVFNVPVGTEWTDLREHFVQAGQIAFCGIDAALKGKGKKGRAMENFPPAGPVPRAVGRPFHGSAWSNAQQPGQMVTDPNFGGGCQEPSSSSGKQVGEIRFDSAATAQQAIALLNGSAFSGANLSVVQDGGCRDGSRVLVFGVPPESERNDLKVHFEQAGRVEFCGWKGKGQKGKGKGFGHEGFGNEGSGKGFGHEGLGKANGKANAGPKVSTPETVGEVRFETAAAADQAIRQFNGGLFAGAPLSVALDNTCRDFTRVTVNGVPHGTNSFALREHFAQVGTVAFAGYRPRSQLALTAPGAAAPASAWAGAAAPAPEWAGAAAPALAAPQAPAWPGAAAPAVEGVWVPVREDEYDYDSTTGAMQALESLQQTVPPAEAQAATPPPPPRQRGWDVAAVSTSASPPSLVGEVICNSTAQATQAVQMVSGSHLRGYTLSVHLDASAMGGGTLTVYNLPADCTSAELQAHFVDSGVHGAPPYVFIHEGSVPPPGPVVDGASGQM